MAPKKKIEQKPHEYKRDMRSYFALPKQQASRASTTNAQSASAPSASDSQPPSRFLQGEWLFEDVVKDDQRQIFAPIPKDLELGSNGILTTTNLRTKTSRDSEDKQRKRKAIAVNIGITAGRGRTDDDECVLIDNPIEVAAAVAIAAASDAKKKKTKNCRPNDDVDEEVDSDFEDEDSGIDLTTAWSNCSEELRNNEDTTKPDMLIKTFCQGGIHDVKATGRYYIAGRASMSEKQVNNWERYFQWLGFHPDHPDEFKTCRDLIKEAHPDWTDDKIANLSFTRTKTIMKELGYSGTTGWDLHHLLLQAMGGLDNPMNLLPLKKPNHMGVHLMLPLNFRNHVLSKPNLYVSVDDIARLLNADEDDLTAITEAYIMACTCKSIAMRGNTNGKGHGPPKGNTNAKGHGAPKGNTNAKGQNQALDANHGTNHSWSHQNRFDAALIKISQYPDLSRPEFLKQTKLAPDLSYKYTQQLNRMLRKIKKEGIDFLEPTSDAAKAAYTKLTKKR